MTGKNDAADKPPRPAIEILKDLVTALEEQRIVEMDPAQDIHDLVDEARAAVGKT